MKGVSIVNEETWSRRIAQLDARAFKNTLDMRDTYICGGRAMSDVGKLKESAIQSIGLANIEECYASYAQSKNSSLSSVGDLKEQNIVNRFLDYEKQKGVLESAIFDSLSVRGKTPKTSSEEIAYEKSWVKNNGFTYVFNPQTMIASLNLKALSDLIEKAFLIFITENDEKLRVASLAFLGGMFIVSAIQVVIEQVYAGKLNTEQIEFLKDLVKAQRGDCKYLLVKDYKREGLTEESVAELQRIGLISIEHLLNTSEDGSNAKGDEVYVLQDELIIED